MLESIDRRDVRAQTSELEQAQIRDPRVIHAISAISKISRTCNGISDTSVSEDKLELLEQGQILARTARANIGKALDYLFARDYKLGSEADVEELFWKVADIVNEGLVDKSKQGAVRKWPGKDHEYPPESEIPKLLNDFYHGFYFRTRAEQDPVRFAAWSEQTINLGIHALPDGCGRVAAVFGAWILGEHNLMCPVHENGAVCFKNMKSDFESWLGYYRSLVSSEVH